MISGVIMTIVKSSPFTVAVRSRRNGDSVKTVSGLIEMRIHPGYTETNLLIPDRRKSQWTRKQKFERYLSGVTVQGLNPADCIGNNWGIQAREAIARLYREAIAEVGA